MRVSPAIKGSIRLIVNADAVLFPRDQANIVPKISAPVRRFLVNRGDHVKQGQLLAELEARDLAAAAQESRGQYEQAQSNYRSTTAVGVPEQMTKAQTDVDGRARGDGRRASGCSTTASSCSRTARSRKKLVDEAEVALRAGEGRLRHRAAAPAGAAERRRQGADQHRGGAGRGGEGPVRERAGAGQLRRDPQPDHRRRHRPAAVSGRDGGGRHAAAHRDGRVEGRRARQHGAGPGEERQGRQRGDHHAGRRRRARHRPGHHRQPRVGRRTARRCRSGCRPTIPASGCTPARRCTSRSSPRRSRARR